MNRPYRLNHFILADPSKCIGCRICEIACSTAHLKGQRPLTTGNLQDPVQPRLTLVRTGEGSVPVQCRQCEDAPCATVCPVFAITQTDGIISINERLCIGCKTCILACPFGALKLVPVFENGVPVRQNLPLFTGPIEQQNNRENHEQQKQLHIAIKCDRCLGLDEPACVANCPKQALKIVSPEKHLARRIHEAALNLAAVAGKYAD